MEKLYWTSTDIIKLYRLKNKISQQTLYNAEEKGLIPKAERISRGKIQVRRWHVEQIPIIGTEFGFLDAPKKQIRICIYSPKGGVLKTTLGYNLAKILALNGIKTLIIGLEPSIQAITNYTLPKKIIESLEESQELEEDYNGLYHFLFEKHPLESIIKKTPLPTLDIIPETPELNHLDFKLKLAVRNEYVFLEKLIDNLQNYQVILFDNNCFWNKLVENSLIAANTIITPMGCDYESYKSIDKNMFGLFHFLEQVKIKNTHVLHVPTLLERNKLSQQIYAQYMNNYANALIPFPIRRSIKGQEARAFNQCVLEHEPGSELSQDYYDVVTEIWSRINKDD